jgi:hypothetical protein
MEIPSSGVKYSNFVAFCQQILLVEFDLKPTLTLDQQWCCGFEGTACSMASSAELGRHSFQDLTF